ncbi:MAG: serine/threonine protein kinase, partial [Myxococcales bacterium]|nr:serine/threonine protein kinase [Myxococcales bacterium]
MTATNEQRDPRVGSLVADKYRVLRLIGEGGMGRVYEAENTAIGKRVALKFLHINARDDETSLARFQREARAISAVESAHIVQVFDWGQARPVDDDPPSEAMQPFLVMELLEGRDLAGRIERLGRIVPAEAVRFAVEALRGLRRVHAAGIVHRDLKPENLFLVTGDDDRLHVKIVDFGLSKLSEGTEIDGPEFGQSAKLTQAGMVVGTPLYMSPEQVEGLVEVDHRADIWAMGAILYEMLAGRPPFMDRSYARLVMAICQRDPVDITRLNPDVTPALARVIEAALTRERDQRLASADDFIAALAAVAPTVDVGGSGVSGSVAVSKTLPADRPHAVVTPPAAIEATLPSLADAQLAKAGGQASPEPVGVVGGPLDATIAAHTRGAATIWLTDAPLFSIWRGEVDAPDRLRVEARDGSVRDLRLEPRGPLTLGRVPQVGGERNDLVYPDVASRLAARLDHDGMRWWLERREECSVPVQVGTRPLSRGERAPLVHGTFVTVGAMRATFVDRRYVSRSVPAGAIDPATGLMARAGLEQEVATALQQTDPFALVLLLMAPGDKGESLSPAAAMAIHKAWPGIVVAREEDTAALLLRQSEADARAREAAQVAASCGGVMAVGLWRLEGEAASAGSELELAYDAIMGAGGPGAKGLAEVVDLRGRRRGLALSDPRLVIERARSPKQQVLLFGIEEQAALQRIGPRVVGALEDELAAVIQTRVGPGAVVTKLAPGVVGACFSRKIAGDELGVDVLCEWHGRSPITDGKVELPRALSWEEVLADQVEARAQELSQECSDAHGVLSALSGGLPYPIAGRVNGAIGAASAVERVKMLFDVLEGTWRFIAVVLAAAYFAKTPAEGQGAPSGKVLEQWQGFFGRVRGRNGLPLGSWRELARLCTKGFEAQDDPIRVLAGELLDVKLAQNQTFDTLSNLLHSERNNFAHGHYSEARAAADIGAFEQMTRLFLRALWPLAAWTLVTVQRTEPDLYGESQTVDFIDHTGPHATGARRRIGFNSPVRLANVVYLARWRDGLVLPLEPWIRRLASHDRFSLYWMEHVPRPGP